MRRPRGIERSTHLEILANMVKVMEFLWIEVEGVFAVTQGQYQAVTRRNPSHFSNKGAGEVKVAGLDTTAFPVEQVSWQAACESCRREVESVRRVLDLVRSATARPAEITPPPFEQVLARVRSRRCRLMKSAGFSPMRSNALYRDRLDRPRSRASRCGS